MRSQAMTSAIAARQPTTPSSTTGESTRWRARNAAEWLAIELVSHAPDRQDVGRVGGVRLDLLAQPPHMYRHGGFVGDVFGAPDTVEQLVAREDLARMA